MYETITQEDYLYTAKTIHLTHYHVLERHELMEIIEELNLKVRLELFRNSFVS